MNIPSNVATAIEALPYVSTGIVLVVAYIKLRPLYLQLKADWLALKQLLKETHSTSTAPIAAVAGEYPFMVQSAIDNHQFNDIDTLLVIYHEAVKDIDEPLTDMDKTSIFYRVCAEVEKVESARKNEVIAGAVTKAAEDYQVRNMLNY